MKRDDQYKKVERRIIASLEEIRRSMRELHVDLCKLLDEMHKMNLELIAYLQRKGPKPNFKNRRVHIL